MDDAVTLGEGVLTWPREERASDRFGCITLMAAPDSRRHVKLRRAPAGARGSLVAHVLENRETSYIHVGDQLWGLEPSIAAVGEAVTLGTGTLFTGKTAGVHVAGLMPDDGRATNWLDPAALRRCHEQTVRLEFHPEPHGRR